MSPLGIFRLGLAACSVVLPLPAQQVDELCRLQRELLESKSPSEAGLDRRLGLLADLIRKDPRRALASALTADQAASLRARGGGRIEQTGSWEGDLIVLSSDDFESGKSETLYRLAGPAGTLEIYPVNPEDAPPECGARVRIEGIRAGSVVAGSLSVVDRRQAAVGQCRPTGVQKILVVPVESPSYPRLPISKEAIIEAYFGQQAPSLAHYWSEASYGKAWLEGEVLDPVRLENDYECNKTDAMAAEVWKALAQRPDLGEYSRLAILFPYPKDGCNFAGLGHVGCNTRATAANRNNLVSVHWIPIREGHLSANLASVAIHEGGHNLGLWHASSMKYGAVSAGPPGVAGEHTEYGDPFSNMGGGWGHYNARQKRQLNWLEEREVLSAELPGSYSAEPLTSASSGAKALRIRRSASPEEWIWLETRVAEGYYERNLNPTVFGGSLVHLESTFNQNNTKASYPGFTHLLDMTPATSPGNNYFSDARLVSGGAWDDVFSPLKVKVERDSESGRLLAEVTHAPSCAQVVASTIEHGPGRESATIQVRAPADCRWAVYAPLLWLQVEDADQERTGDAELAYTIAANQSARARSGWISVGRKPILFRQSAEPKAPGALSLTPEDVKGSSASLTADFTDPEGPEDLAVLRISIGANPGSAGSCTVEYDVKEKTVRLLADDGAAWLGPVPTARSGELFNSSCRLRNIGCYQTGAT